MSPEVPYESRYFSVLFNDEGEVVFINTEKTVSIDTMEPLNMLRMFGKNREIEDFIKIIGI